MADVRTKMECGRASEPRRGLGSNSSGGNESERVKVFQTERRERGLEKEEEEEEEAAIRPRQAQQPLFCLHVRNQIRSH